VDSQLVLAIAKSTECFLNRRLQHFDGHIPVQEKALGIRPANKPVIWKLLAKYVDRRMFKSMITADSGECRNITKGLKLICHLEPQEKNDGIIHWVLYCAPLFYMDDFNRLGTATCDKVKSRARAALPNYCVQSYP
jgi:hypothetical protein